jgi:flagellar hook-basal body complex protein FliE
MSGVEAVNSQAVFANKAYADSSKLGLDSAGNSPVKEAEASQAEFRQALEAASANPGAASESLKISPGSMASGSGEREDIIDIAGNAISSVKSEADKASRVTQSYVHGEASEQDLTTAIKNSEFSLKTASTILEKFKDFYNNIINLQL